MLVGLGHGGVGSGFESVAGDEGCAGRAALGIALFACLVGGRLLA